MRPELQSADVDLAPIEACLERRVGPLAKDPERHWQPAVLDALTRDLAAAGLLDGAPASAKGLWARPAEPDAVRFTCASLRLVARFSADLALHFHRLGLAQWLLRQLNRQPPGDPFQIAVTVQGGYGFGGEGLPLYLRSRPLSEAYEYVLADCYAVDPDGMALVAAPNWQHVLRPVWCEGDLQWQLCDRSAFSVQAMGAHALDALGHHRLRAAAHARGETHAPICARELFAAALTLESLGLLAIATGVLDRGAALAGDYAQSRRQGGQRLIAHAAVQRMLGGIEQARRRAELELDRLATLPAASRLGNTLACRAGLQPELRRAGDEVVQLHGGLGYMRLHGAEKVLREQNQLLLLSGTPTELRLFLALWERTP